jgi:L-aminopeptidase/D-esterase-like protein
MADAIAAEYADRELSMAVRAARWAAVALLCGLWLTDGRGEAVRARGLGVPFEGKPGRFNAMTDVPGVQVGQVTLVSGDPAGAGPVVRTGVTVVLPRGQVSDAPVYGGYFDLNGNGELTGQAYLQDFGLVHGPIGISNTNAIGQVYAGIQQWSRDRFGSATWPVVAETWDGYLNDIEGFHVAPADAVRAIEQAAGGAVAEGNVGGGTGMVCFDFKGGIGTASRVVSAGGKTYTVGVLVQCNTGARDVLRIAGVPVGHELANVWLPCFEGGGAPDRRPACRVDGMFGVAHPDQGSIIIVVGTDAPLQPLQLNRLARRAAMGLARLGSYSGDLSGDLVVAFSTMQGVNDTETERAPLVASVANVDLDPLFEATVQATEEAVVNALVAAQTMTGLHGYRVYRLPHGTLQTILKHYGRLAGASRAGK